MSSFILRKIDPDLWVRVKVRATADGMTLKGVLLALLRGYAAGEILIHGMRE